MVKVSELYENPLTCRVHSALAVVPPEEVLVSVQPDKGVALKFSLKAEAPAVVPPVKVKLTVLPAQTEALEGVTVAADGLAATVTVAVAVLEQPLVVPVTV